MTENEERLSNLKAFKEVQSRPEHQAKYKNLADIALTDPKSFPFYYAAQQAEQIIIVWDIIKKTPFKAIQTTFDSWLDKVADPRNSDYLYITRVSDTKLEVDWYRLRKSFLK